MVKKHGKNTTDDERESNNRNQSIISINVIPISSSINQRKVKSILLCWYGNKGLILNDSMDQWSGGLMV